MLKTILSEINSSQHQHDLGIPAVRTYATHDLFLRKIESGF